MTTPTRAPLSFIEDLARASGEYLRPLHGDAGLAVDLKSDASPVTAADRGAEALMRDMIERTFPDHGILGEEHGTVRPDAEWVWVLDPIDGTKSFITGVPLWTTLIGLLHRGVPVLGCIHQPVLGQLVIGDGQRTTCNGRPVSVRTGRTLSDATLLTSDIGNLARYQDGPACQGLLDSVRLVRTWADGYGYLLVATGWADICLDPIMNPWDIAALVPVVRGAGGVITDWSGGPAYPAASTVAASPDLHPQVIAALCGAPGASTRP
jgi:histidinol phosphatase-like enzyme (inositol monophosphatase family)